MHKIPSLRLYDGFVIIFHIVLRNFTLVDFFLLGQKVNGERLLQKGIAFVFFVCQDGFNTSGTPFVFAAGCFSISGKINAADKLYLILENVKEDKKHSLVKVQIGLGKRRH